MTNLHGRQSNSNPNGERASLESLLAEPWSPPSASAGDGARSSRKAGKPTPAHRKAAEANAISRAVFDEIVYALMPAETPKVEKAQHEKALGGLFKGSGGFCRSNVGQREAARAANWSERSQSEHQQAALDALKYPAIVLTQRGKNGLGVSRYDFDFMTEAIGRVTARHPVSVKAAREVARSVLEAMLAERGVTIELTPPYAPEPRPETPAGDEKPKRRTHAEAEREYIERRGSLAWAQEIRDVMTAEEFAELRRAIERVDTGDDDDGATESNTQWLRATLPETTDFTGDEQTSVALKSRHSGVITPDVAAVPPELAALPNWVVWSYGAERSKGKREKVPFNPRTGRAASHSDPSTWGTLGQAVRMYEEFGYDGIGFVLTLAAGFVVADFDGCLDSDGEFIPDDPDPETGDIDYVAALRIGRLDSYTEVSPSGTGVHVWTRGTLPPGRRRCAGVEVYETERYICFTGRLVADSPDSIHERTPELASFHEEVFGDTEPDGAGEPAKVQPVSAPMSDEAIITKLLAEPNGKAARLFDGDTEAHDDADRSPSAADFALCRKIAFYTDDAEQVDRIFCRSELVRDEWTKGTSKRRLTIARALAGTTTRYRGKRLAAAS